MPVFVRSRYPSDPLPVLARAAFGSRVRVRVGDFIDALGDAASDVGDAATSVTGDIAQGVSDGVSATGDVASSAVDDFGDAASSFADAVTSVPGFKELAGLIGDFAKTDLGVVVTRALAGALYAAAVPFAGPQLASLTFAAPQVIAGNKNFADAYAKELGYRVDGVIDYFTPEIANDISGALTDGIKKAGSWLEDQGISPDEIGKWLADKGITPQWLAAKLGIREDAAQAAIDAAAGSITDLNANFDASNGAQYGASAQVLRSTMNVQLGQIRKTSLASLLTTHPSFTLPSPQMAAVRARAGSLASTVGPSVSKRTNVAVPTMSSKPGATSSAAPGDNGSFPWTWALAALAIGGVGYFALRRA